MAYFSAVLAGRGGSWRTLDVDLDDAVDLDDTAEEVRAAAEDEGLEDAALLVVLEHEDEWFALVRADGGAEPRVFVSDLLAVQSGRYAELLAGAADAPAPQPPAPEDDEGSASRVAAPTWAGDTGLLADAGVPDEELTATAEAADPAGALASVGERLGFADQLEALR
ncbi:hypothetical protein [Quadrisphaera sp. DSM 44207]|uniref:tRNA adenosine deaminase-associated protein n=1 Tax=Quadrisphaera sp. DSM 44207 TaxID=1881057 RepID=UPI00087FBBBF|nr:hypothetical protein [Quadrisphaera sp. DSM 44207]SDQ18598.1 putative tRNA adenosine deaminase-associated protein [Quadrisphaera sp. DSM 44207]